MGQNNNHKSNFHFLILGCKSFAVNYSLKSGMHRHHQTLVSSLVMLCQASTATVFSSCLFLGHFPFSFVFSKWNACSIGFRSGDWLGHCITVHFLSLQKLFGCFCSMLWVIVHLHCEAPSNEFWSIWLEYEQIILARNTSEFILLLLSAVTSSINTREPVPLAAIHAHAMTLPPHASLMRWYA